MPNIKISFQHPSYLYPFRVSLNSSITGADIERLNFKNIEASLDRLKKEIILTSQEDKILSSLSLGFKEEYMAIYKKTLNERKRVDYIGDTRNDHCLYFQNLCRGKIEIKQMLQLHHYISRTIKSDHSFEGSEHEQWIKLSLLFHTNFITASDINPKMESNQKQLQNYASFFVIVDQVSQLIEGDKSLQAINLNELLPLIQDTIIQSYFKLKTYPWQEQALVSVIEMSKVIISYLKAKNSRNSPNQEVGSKIVQKQEKQSIIYWLINFTPKNKRISTSAFNSHSILELALFMLPKSLNLYVGESLINFVKILFEEVSSFGELLFLITELIRFEFPQILESIMKKILHRQFKTKQMVRQYFQFDLSELFGRGVVEQFKLKQMIKVGKYNEKGFTHSLRQVHKLVNQFNNDFNKYRMGKITFKRTVKVGGVSQEEVEEREILNIERLAEESHHHLKSQEIITMELYRQNEELIRVNKWLQERIKKYQQTISTMVHIDTKQTRRVKLKHQREVVKQKIFPSRMANSYKPFVYEASLRKSSDGKINHSLQSIELINSLHKIDVENVRKSYQASKINGHQDILSEIPSIDVPQNRSNMHNSSNQVNIVSQQIFNDAKNKLNKAMELPSNDNKNFILPPPPPPPSFNKAAILPPPPPPLLSPPPPPLSLIPPPPPSFGLPSISLLPLPGLPSLPGEKPKDQVKNDLKNIGWTVLESQKIKGTIWQLLQQNSIAINQQDIKKYFGRKQQIVSSKSIVAQTKSLMKPDRSKNIQIILRKMKLSQKNFKALQQAFLIYDANYINQDILSSLQNIMPNAKQKSEYPALNMEEQQTWTLGDRFIKFAVSVEAFEEKISSILFKYEYEDAVQIFFIKLSSFTKFYEDLHQDEFFRTFLQYFLAIGNHLNANTFRSNAKAFRIENIDKSYLLTGQDKQTSLFQYVLLEVHKHRPELFEYPTLMERQEMIVSLSVLRDDYNYFQKKCEIVNQCILLSEENSKDESAGFFLPFYMQTREDVNLMKSKLEDATFLFKTVKEFYGDKLESEEMARFIIDFRKRVCEFKSKKLKMAIQK